MLIHGLVVADSGSASTDDPVADSHIADLAAICEASGVPVGRRLLSTEFNSTLPEYRLNITTESGKPVTFPFYASQDITKGGSSYKKAVIFSHGGLRDADKYFCLGLSLLKTELIRGEILLITPSFRYHSDVDYKYTRQYSDLYWNSSKGPAGGDVYSGDWRNGAPADPASGEIIGRRRSQMVKAGGEISSYTILDRFVQTVTDKKYYPNIGGVTVAAHSAGGQLVQRYALMTHLLSRSEPVMVAKLDFIVANPSSYAYMDSRRWKYTCGNCTCGDDDCTCDGACTWDESTLELATYDPADAGFVCSQAVATNWGYGVSNFEAFQYVEDRNVTEAIEDFPQRSVSYLAGQNDTCNNNLATCEASCWQNPATSTHNQLCYRNSMDTRCGAMLQGPYRRGRARKYHDYLMSYYGNTADLNSHAYTEIDGCGHDASCMFSSDTAQAKLKAVAIPVEL